VYVDVSSAECRSQTQHKDRNIYNENVPQLKYLGTTGPNQNLILEEIKKRLISGNDCHHSVQNISPYRLLSKNITIMIIKNRILLLVLCGCKTWPVTLREQCRLMENGVFWVVTPSGSCKNRLFGGT
jgi:hypothetical protein